MKTFCIGRKTLGLLSCISFSAFAVCSCEAQMILTLSGLAGSYDGTASFGASTWEINEPEETISVGQDIDNLGPLFGDGLLNPALTIFHDQSVDGVALRGTLHAASRGIYIPFDTPVSANLFEQGSLLGSFSIVGLHLDDDGGANDDVALVANFDLPLSTASSVSLGPSVATFSLEPNLSGTFDESFVAGSYILDENLSGTFSITVVPEPRHYGALCSVVLMGLAIYRRA